MTILKTLPFFALLLAACSPPKPVTPYLTPQTASELLHYDTKAEAWMTHVRRQDPSCEYKLELPDQTNHPAQIDLQHIVSCANRPSPRELDASVSFRYDKATQHWVIERFSS
jgi:hypothetical protein